MDIPTSSTEGVSDSPSSRKSSAARSKPDGLEKQQRKRIRVPTSCSICRKRKIKCDKNKPFCSGCSKSNVGHLCQYEEPSWVNPDDSIKQNKAPGTISAAIVNLSKVSDVSNLISKPLLPDVNTPMPLFNGMNLNDLPPQYRRTFEELTARVKHLEASIAVHDLSSSITKGSNNAANSTLPASPFPTTHTSSNSFTFLPPPSTFNLSQSSLNGKDFISNNVIQPSEPKDSIYDFDINAKVQLFECLPFFIKKTRLECHGPFSMLSLMRQDAYLKVLWIHIFRTIEQSHSQLTAGKSINSNDDPPSCLNHVIAQEAMNQESGKATSRGIASFLAARKSKIKEKAASKELIDTHKNLKDMILAIFPSPKNMITLCVRFFRHVYPFLPFIDENTFFSELDTLTSPSGYSSDKLKTLNINSKYDYAVLGLMLLVFRFAYISISEEEFRTNKEFASLKENPITVTAVDVAFNCFQHYKILRKPYSLKVMQLGLYLKLYYRYCPEDDDVSDCSSSSILLGTLFAMGYSIGLNRDPNLLTKISDNADNKPQAQIWKKIWHKLLELDSTQALAFGFAMQCPNNHSYNTPLPVVSTEDDAFDSFANKDFVFLQEKTELFRKIANTCHNMNEPPTTLQVIKLLKALEIFAMTKLGTFKEILNDTNLSKFAMVKKICYLLEIRVVVLHLVVILQRTFENLGDYKNSYEYLVETLQSVTKISNSLMNLVYNETLYFGNGYFYYLKPTANFAITRCVLVLVATNIRLIHSHKRLTTRVSLSSSPSSADISRLKLLKDFVTLTFSNLETILQLFNKMSTGSYNFSKIYMAMRLYYLQLDNPSFDFKEVADKILDDIDNNRVSRMVIHDLKPEDIPQSNQFDVLLDPEIRLLMDIIRGDIFTILQPAVSPEKSKSFESNTPITNNHISRTSSSSAVSNDPFNSYNPPLSNSDSKSTGDTPTSCTDSAETPINPLSINPGNIFGLTKQYYGSATKANQQTAPGGENILIPAATTAADGFDATSSSNLLTSEEYASLFGIFDEYNSLGGETHL